MDTSWSNPESLAFVEGLYSDFVADPDSVGPEWRRYFEALANGNGNGNGRTRVGPSFPRWSLFNPPGSTALPTAHGVAREAAELQDRADQMVRAYRVRGHAVAKIDPLDLPRAPQPELEPSFYGFSERDLGRRVSAQRIAGLNDATLGQVLALLKQTYCRSIGVQFMHITDLAVQRWLQDRMESAQNRLALSRVEQLRILTKLTDAVIFEEFIQRKYLGAKSFSLEGSESLVPLLDLAIEHLGAQGAQEIVLAMAHRGRLNVLANILGKNARQIFREFEDADPELHLGGRGDVKYHKGYSSDWTTSAGAKIHLSLCFNPSHLEFVNPVAQGRMRAKQDRFGDRERAKGVVILIHGDAAFIGEGVVQESLNLSELAGYTTGGTVHVVVNNQIGFTTGSEQSRSTQYCTDIAKMLQIPIFHVNGEDPEAVAQVVRLALDFRREFRRDVVIDVWGYRRRGHNEGDEPSFTDPVLYAAIARRKNSREGYLEHLLTLGEVTRAEADEIADRRRAALEEELSLARSSEYVYVKEPVGAIWDDFVRGPEPDEPEFASAVPRERLVELLTSLSSVPPGFQVHPKLTRLLETRMEMARGERELDWSAAEALAFATLVVDGRRVRLTGQDSERGTFSHRHAVLHDYATGAQHVPLAHLARARAPIEIHNSPLSETGVLGFEYGYSLDFPEALVLWEAQFGDFVNVAQPIIDQFIVSAEDKWNRLSGLVMLLPHGFEGQGPEHSSARLERFLSQCADDNIQVANCTTPAQYYHLLRRQALRPWRKPLVVMTPKSLLRHPRATSTLEELATGRFQRILPDARVAAKDVRRVLLVSGKLFYELDEKREADGRKDVAILRVEQYYPLADAAFAAALAPYPKNANVVWVQEEPENMGAWSFWRVRFGERLAGRAFSGISRRASASTATGSGASHKIEQAEILKLAFELA
ncbi:MAG: 2-oxoglutarate dehydrogenase E1 component [Planctomycetes bacterium]|nr:2-oxoglutarate dehydrogenase E1 component [Planctomycetota bacterium]